MALRGHAIGVTATCEDTGFPKKDARFLELKIFLIYTH